MSLHTVMPWLIGTLVVSVAGMTLGGALQRPWVVTVAAAAFSGAAIVAAIGSNLPYWRAAPLLRIGDEVAVALSRNARLIAIAYAWGAAAMQSLYTTPITGLRWQHGWQYALVMLVLSLGAVHVAQGLSQSQVGRREAWLSIAVPLSIANALLAAGGLLFLVLSGKLLVRRPDWAANLVFLFGALTVMVLAAVALKTHARLTRS